MSPVPSRSIGFAALLAWCAGAALILDAGANRADPRGFFDDERIEETELRNGVSWIAASGEFEGRPVRTHILSVDLSDPDIRLGALLGADFVAPEAGQFFRRSTTSRLLEAAGALAAINVAFYDPHAAPQGLVVRDGIVYRNPRPDRVNFIFLKAGSAALGNMEWEARIRHGENTGPLDGINASQLRDGQTALYLPPASHSPGNEAAFTAGLDVLEIVLEPIEFTPAESPEERSRWVTRVRAIRSDEGAHDVGDEEFVLTAAGEAAAFLDEVEIDDEIALLWRLEGALRQEEWHEIREVVSGGARVLIDDGEKQSGSGAFWEYRHPRTAAGISRDGERVIFVVVDGRSEESAGMSLDTLRDYLAHMGAHDAVNFDGGGSSTMAARVDGEIRVLNTPSGGTERYVPTGIGVFVNGEERRD